jgi:nitrogen regulatory protein P-II 1
MRTRNPNGIWDKMAEGKGGYGMKMIQAVIRPERFEDVKSALEKDGHIPLTVWEVSGRGEQRGVTLEFRGKKQQVEILPKLIIEVVVENEQLSSTLGCIRQAAYTGKQGDGKIFVLPIERMSRVRTDEEWT